MTMKRKINLIFIFLILVSCTAFYFFVENDSQKRESYQTTSPSLSSIKKTKYISGVVVPAKEIDIKSRFSGILETLYCQIGDSINEGDKIARIRLVPDPARVENAEKNVRTAFLKFEYNKRLFESNKKLFESEVISANEFESYEQAYLLSREEYNSAVSQLDLLKEGPQNRELGVNFVLSTTSGTVLQLPVREGASVIERNNFSEGTTIARIADLGSLLFKASVNEVDVRHLTPHTILRLTIPSLPQKTLVAELAQIAPKGHLENNIIYFDLEARISNPLATPFMHTGFSAVAKLVLDSRENVLTVEEKNVLVSHDSAYVELWQEDGFQKHFIETGLSDGLVVEVKKGLAAEDKIRIREW